MKKHHQKTLALIFLSLTMGLDAAAKKGMLTKKKTYDAPRKKRHRPVNRIFRQKDAKPQKIDDQMQQIGDQMQRITQTLQNATLETGGERIKMFDNMCAHFKRKRALSWKMRRLFLQIARSRTTPRKLSKSDPYFRNIYLGKAPAGQIMIGSEPFDVLIKSKIFTESGIFHDALQTVSEIKGRESKKLIYGKFLSQLDDQEVMLPQGFTRNKKHKYFSFAPEKGLELLRFLPSSIRANRENDLNVQAEFLPQLLFARNPLGTSFVVDISKSEKETTVSLRQYALHPLAELFVKPPVENNNQKHLLPEDSTITKIRPRPLSFVIRSKAEPKKVIKKNKEVLLGELGEMMASLSIEKIAVKKSVPKECNEEETKNPHP